MLETATRHCWPKLKFYITVQSAKKRKKKDSGADGAEDGSATVAEVAQPSQTLIAESYTPPDPGPYPQDKPPENPVRFTPVQVSVAHVTIRFRDCVSDPHPFLPPSTYTDWHDLSDLTSGLSQT